MPFQQTDWEVEFQLGDPPQTISFIVEGELLLGRTPNGQAEMPSFDLSSHNAVELGISRRHGILTNEGNALSYTDLGSGNGSNLNGTKLTPREAVKIKTGDILYLGHMKVTVTAKQHTRKTSIVAMRKDLKINAMPMQGKGQRILVVEDDQGLAEMYRLALERSGYVVQNAKEMVTAIRALNNQMPSAIMLDLMLPGIRGLELARYVRRDTDVQTVPIIVVSALRDSESIKGAMEAGADIYMSKPVDWKELTQVIGSLVAGGSGTVPQTKKLRGTARLDLIGNDVRQDTIVAFVDSYREPLTLIVQPQITLGRQNPGSSSRTHADLESYEAFEKGVSRVHALIRRKGHIFEIEDLESANGTFVNDKQLSPNQPQPLKNGDEIRLGGMRIRVYFLSETELPKN